jgi:hypothetical protein
MKGAILTDEIYQDTYIFLIAVTARAAHKSGSKLCMGVVDVKTLKIINQNNIAHIAYASSLMDTLLLNGNFNNDVIKAIGDAVNEIK